MKKALLVLTVLAVCMVSMTSVFALNPPKITSTCLFNKDNVMVRFKKVKGAKEYLCFKSDKKEYGYRQMLGGYTIKGSRILVSRGSKDSYFYIMAKNGKKLSLASNIKVIKKVRRLPQNSVWKYIISEVQKGKTSINLDGYGYNGISGAMKACDLFSNGGNCRKSELKKWYYQHPQHWQFLTNNIDIFQYADDTNLFYWIKKGPQVYKVSTKIMSEKKYRKARTKAAKFKKKYSGSDFTKAKKIHDALIRHITYNENRYDQTLYGAEEGKCVCAGFALAYKYMCNYNGIECDAVYNLNSNYPHAWNQVKIGKKWYVVDCTWDNTDDNKKDKSKKETIKYKYFLVAEKNHKYKGNFMKAYNVRREISTENYKMDRKDKKN